MITIYTGANCMPCKLTKRALDQRGITYTELDAVEHADKLRESGHRELPVVVAGDQTWTGFRPDLIGRLNGR